MKNPYHDVEIVVNADRPDWGKQWGIVSDDAEGCWCYECTMEYLDNDRCRSNSTTARDTTTYPNSA